MLGKYNFWLFVGFVVWNSGWSWTRIGVTALILVAALIAALYFYQEKLLYLPRAAAPYITPSSNPPGFQHPGEVGIPYDDVYITTSDQLRLHCWFLKQDNSRDCPTILFFHANAGNMGFRLQHLLLFYEKLSCNIFIISYRGYGESQGEPSEAGLQLDAVAAMEYLLNREDVNPDLIFLYGQSLGGAVAISVAAHPQYAHKIRGTIVENTFTCISEVCDQVFPLLKYIKPFVLRMDWPSLRRMSSVQAPILFLSGLRDELIPASQMEALYQAASSASPSIRHEMVTFPTGTHNDTWMRGGHSYTVAILKFLQTHSRGRGPISAQSSLKKKNNK